MHTPTVRIDIDEDRNDRFSRFKLISWWDQERLGRARVLVVGAGALGNEILKNCALVGIGNILVADMDRIENSNLSRSVLYRESDNGALKAETAARSVKEINPDANVHWFNGNILYDLGLGVYHWADVVIAGLDNREARLAINRNCWRTRTPWIDGAIEQLNGVARVFVPPDGSCYECTMSATDWELLKARRSCNLLSRSEMIEGKTPTTPTSASIIAAVQCQEAIKLLHGLDVIKSRGFVYNGLFLDSYIVEYPRKDDCSSHECYDPIRKTGWRSSGIRIGEVVRSVKDELGSEAIVEFSNELLRTLTCDRCGVSTSVFRSLGSVSEHEGRCSSCGAMRTANTLHSIDGSEPLLDKTFAEIGIAPFDIVTGRAGTDQIFLEFDGDAEEVLGPLYPSYGAKKGNNGRSCIS